MKDRELHKLKRQDLLELLLDQSREVSSLQEEIETLTAAKTELEETLERLKGKLDDKDAQIEHLKSRLDMKDVKIKQLEAKEELAIPVEGEEGGQGGSGAVKREVVFKVPIDELFTVARNAVSEYLAKIK